MGAAQVHSAYCYPRCFSGAHAQWKDGVDVRKGPGIDAVKMIRSSAFLAIGDGQDICAFLRQFVTEHRVRAVFVLAGLG